MVNLIKATLKFLAVVLIGPLLYVTVFRLQILSGISILFYRGLCLAALVALVQLLIVLALRREGWLRLETGAAAVLLAAAANLLFLIVFPVTFERSITIFLMNYIEAQQGSPVETESLERAFIDNYVREKGAIRGRIDEQLQSGNLEQTPAGFRLTGQGEKFLRLAREIERLLGLQGLPGSNSEIRRPQPTPAS